MYYFKANNASCTILDDLKGIKVIDRQKNTALIGFEY